MSAPNSAEVNTSLTGDETHSLGIHEVEEVGNAATNSSVPISSEEAARQIKAATNPLTKQLEKLCDLLRELRRDAPRRSEETSGLIQGPSRPRGDRFDTAHFVELSDFNFSSDADFLKVSAVKRHVPNSFLHLSY